MIIDFLKSIDKKFKFDYVSAHCDIPCKIYDPSVAIIAALSVVRMVDLMEELSKKDDNSLLANNTMSRYIREKEDQAKICKNEINIIWGDYFKDPQIEKFPKVHEIVHKIMMAASKTKQEPSKKVALNLVDLVNQFAEIFWASKGIKTKKIVCPYPPSLEVVYPEII